MSSTFMSVSSHPFHTIREEEEEEGGGVISSTVDIHGQSVPSDILVALLDRQTEMKELVARNYPFYDTIQHSITDTQGEDAWVRFQDILYKPRPQVPDRVWINQIAHYLSHNPVFFSKFKDIVGYEDNDDDVSPLFYKRRSRQFSNSSSSGVGDDNDDEEVYESIFTEDPFQQQRRRRRSSYHSIQSEPHPTFVDVKIDEVDEANIDQPSDNDDSDHLADLLDDDDDDDDDIIIQEEEHRQGYYKHHSPERDLVRLREFPEIQQQLYKTHPSFFRKAKQLLSMAPSARRFSATRRRNSILEDAMPPSPVTELEEPRMQAEEQEQVHLEQLICCTRRQQPDDIAWLNSVMEALAGWPELIDRLHEIIQESLED